ncbi:hypothetical protein BH24BAC1_BH24BAC1_25940 [soil metagenome]
MSKIGRIGNYPQKWLIILSFLFPAPCKAGQNIFPFFLYPKPSRENSRKRKEGVRQVGSLSEPAREEEKKNQNLISFQSPFVHLILSSTKIKKTESKNFRSIEVLFLGKHWILPLYPKILYLSEKKIGKGRNLKESRRRTAKKNQVVANFRMLDFNTSMAR